LPVTSNSPARYAKSTPSGRSPPTACRHTVSGTISLPFRGTISPFPHGTSPLSVTREYLALEGGPPRFGPRFTGAVLLRNVSGRPCAFAYGTVTRCGASIPRASANTRLCNSRQVVQHLGKTPYNPRQATLARLHLPGLGWIPFRSPLLGESRLISFPRGTEMFQFPRLPSLPYVFRQG
jgi:hypothetical protein